MSHYTRARLDCEFVPRARAEKFALARAKLYIPGYVIHELKEDKAPVCESLPCYAWALLKSRSGMGRQYQANTSASGLLHFTLDYGVRDVILLDGVRSAKCFTALNSMCI